MSIPLKIKIIEDFDIEKVKEEIEMEIVSEINKIQERRIEIYQENVGVEDQYLIIDIHGINFAELNIRYYIQKMIKFSSLYAEKKITKNCHIADYLFYDDDIFFIVENDLIAEMAEQNPNENFLVKNQFEYMINKKEKSIIKRIIQKYKKSDYIIVQDIINTSKNI